MNATYCFSIRSFLQCMLKGKAVEQAPDVNLELAINAAEPKPMLGQMEENIEK